MEPVKILVKEEPLTESMDEEEEPHVSEFEFVRVKSEPDVGTVYTPRVKEELTDVKECDYQPVMSEFQLGTHRVLTDESDQWKGEAGMLTPKVEPKDELTVDDHILGLGDGPDETVIYSADERHIDQDMSNLASTAELKEQNAYNNLGTPEVSAQIDPISETQCMQNMCLSFEHSTNIVQNIQPSPTVLKKNTNNKIYKCEVCGKCFNLGSRLKTHIKIHTGEKSYKCEQCGKCFVTKSNYIRHLRIHIGEKNYKCGECGKGFNLSGYLKMHLSTHTGEKNYKCEECYKCFTLKGALLRHMRFHKGEKNHKCKECGKRFVTSSNLKRHVRIHTGENNYKCVECGTRFNHINSLMRHVRIHMNENTDKDFLKVLIKEEPESASTSDEAIKQKDPLVADDGNHSVNQKFETTKVKEEWSPVEEEDNMVSCKVEPKNELTIDEHIIEHEEGPVETEISGSEENVDRVDCNVAEYPESYSLSKSQVDVNLGTSEACAKYTSLKAVICDPIYLQGFVHSKLNYGMCKECGKSFARNSDLERHIRIHNSGKNYKCLECGKCFKQNHSLKNHLMIHNNERNYKCDQCGKSFIREYSLKMHLRIHTGENNYKCGECGKSFIASGELKRHLRIHTGEKNYKCGECGKCFREKGKLKVHLRIHTGEKNYKCKECGKCFNHSGTLKGHLKIHTGEKNHKCEVCGKRFTRSADLKTHIRIHTGEKNYKCPECFKCFYESSRLKMHLRIHNNEMNYKCHHCDKCFISSYRLKKHLKTHAGEKQGE